MIKFSWQDEIANASEILLRVGESFHVPQGLRHQMKAVEETELFEISTTHFDSDSIRIVKGDWIEKYFDKLCLCFLIAH